MNHSSRAVVSYKRKYVHKVLVNCLFKLAQEKVWIGELTVPPSTIAVDLGRKATKQTNNTLLVIVTLNCGEFQKHTLSNSNCDDELW